jgi:hypothetical protein
MHTIYLQNPDAEKYIPSTLAECDEQQYMDMCELILKFQTGLISYENLRVLAIYKLLNMVPKNNISEDQEELKNLEVYNLSEMIDSFFEHKEDNQKVIIQDYIHNPVPCIKPLWKTYYGISNQFQNVTFGEYTDALRLFYQFNATANFEILYALAAIFYRKKKNFHFISKQLNSYDGDIRKSYNPTNVDKRVKVFKYAPIGFVYGVYLLFASFQKFISSAQVPWGGKVLNLSILFDGPTGNEPEENASIGMDSIMFTMAESGAFGDLQKVQKTNLWQILIRMYDIRVRDLAEQKRQNNANNQQP